MNGSETFRALLVGVWKYDEDSDFQNLLGPPNDLINLRHAFQEPPTGIFAVSTLENPSAGKLRAGIQDFLSASTDEHLLVYFSGHADIGQGGHLCLTSRESNRKLLDALGLRFDELYEWVRASPARSVTVILDCCKAGSGFTKGSEPDIASYFDRTEGPGDELGKTIKILAAVPGYTNAPDAETAEDMSPFTADLYEAVTGSAVADERGLVTLSAVVARLRAMAKKRNTTQARVWGGDAGRDPYLAMRPDHLSHLLERCGLREGELVRRGALMLDGKEIRLEADQVSRLVTHFEEHHPTAATIGGPVNSGKTWVLCDVRDQLSAAGWHTVELEPTVDLADGDQLHLALQKYALGLRGHDKRCLILIDGIGWSDAWSDFVRVLEDLTRLEDTSGFGVSVLVALESAQQEIQRSWQPPSGLNLPSIAQSGVTKFIARLMSPEFVPALADWDEARLAAARNSLQQDVGTDLWAAVQLAPRWHEPDTDKTVIRELWRERIGNITPSQVTALQLLAGLGRYNLWCPLRLVTAAGDVLLRVGVEYDHAHDAVRLNSGFLNRAILVRQIRDGKPHFLFEKSAADKSARPIVRRYLAELLADENRQDELATAFKQLRYRRHVLIPAVSALARPGSDGVSPWEKWADLWGDLGPVNVVLIAVRSELPPRVMAALAGRFFRHVIDYADEGLSLWTIVGSLETAYHLQQGRGHPSVEADHAITQLVRLAEEKLRTGRWPSGLRHRLLRALRRLNRLDDTAAQELGPALLQPASPPTVADILLVLDFAKLVARGLDQQELRAQIATWDSVAEQLVRRPDGTGVRSGLSLLAGRAILARFIGDEPSAERLVRQLSYAVKHARAGELGRALSLCRRHDRPLAGSMAAELDVDVWSAGIYLGGTPQGVAQLLATLGGLRPDLAVRTLRFAGDEVDDNLVQTMAHHMVAGPDPVGASMLLRSAARIEEQCGVLEGGFAQALAAALGKDFLIDNLRGDSRISVLSYLIEGYAAVQSPVLASVKDDALEIVENDIRNSGSERGPRLALILADDAVLGEAFLDSLRARRKILRSFMLVRMTETTNAGALTAYHELGVALFPSIEKEFAEWLLDSGTEWSEHHLFKHLANYGNVVSALRAATAVTTTLVLNGEPDPGSQVLTAFDRADEISKSSTDWSNHVAETTSESLSEALILLRGLDPRRARLLTERRRRKLERTLIHSDANSLASTLSSIATISAETARELTGSILVGDAIKKALSHVLDEADAFAQLEFLRALNRVENQIYTRLVPTDLAEEFRRQWAVSANVITNPRLLAGFVETAGNENADHARQMAALINLPRVGTRLQRRNALDVEGATSLVNVLGELSATSVTGLLGPDEVRWLLLSAPLRTSASLLETLLMTWMIAPEEAASVLAIRFRLSTSSIRMRDQHTYWISVGWIAWTLKQFGVTLDLDEPANSKALRGVHPQTALWATAWLTHLPWAASALENAAVGIRSAARPPQRAWAAAAVLTVEAQLGKDLAANHSEWVHCLDAEPRWVRALIKAAVPGSRLRETFRGLWPPLQLAKVRAGLQWNPHRWHRTALEAEKGIEELLRR